MIRTLCIVIAASLAAGCSPKENTSESKSNDSTTSPTSSSDKSIDHIPENTADEAFSRHGVKEITRLASKGDPKAQFFMAVANLTGTAVPKNEVEAYKWALRSANQGTTAAQYLLGRYYLDKATHGQDLMSLEPNLIRGYIWLNLAASQGHANAAKYRSEVESNMEQEWIMKAQMLSSKWSPCTSLSCQTQDIEIGVSTYCERRPQSVLCIGAK